MELTNEIDIEQVIKNLSDEQLEKKLDQTNGEIQQILSILKEEARLDEPLYTSYDRFKIKSAVIAKYNLYEKIYKEWEIRKKRAFVRNWLETNPIIKKYKDLGIIR